MLNFYYSFFTVFNIIKILKRVIWIQTKFIKKWPLYKPSNTGFQMWIQLMSYTSRVMTKLIARTSTIVQLIKVNIKWIVIPMVARFQSFKDIGMLLAIKWRTQSTVGFRKSDNFSSRTSKYALSKIWCARINRRPSSLRMTRLSFLSSRLASYVSSSRCSFFRCGTHL